MEFVLLHFRLNWTPAGLGWMFTDTNTRRHTGGGGVQLAGRPYRFNAGGADDQRDVPEVGLLRYPGRQLDVDEPGTVGKE